MGRKRLNLFVFMLIAIPLSVVLSFLLDGIILSFASSLHGTYIIEPLLDLFSSDVLFLSIVVFFAVLIYIRKPGWLLVYGVGIVGSFIVNYLLKFMFHRERPPLNYAYLFQGGFSFPSSHAYLSFFAATIAAFVYHEYRFEFIGLAVVIALSRVLLAVHYFSDVMVGSILGYFTGVIVIMVTGRYLKKLG